MLAIGSCSAGDTQDASDSVVGVRGIACDEPTRGVGVVIGEERVLTNAHVVAGVDELLVDGRMALLVGFDANRDLALLSVPGLRRESVEVGTASAGDVGSLLAIDATDTLVRHPYEVRRPIRATGDDIYRNEGADRRAFEVEVAFAQGWSGSGLFDREGRLVAVAFAESRTDPELTYAVADSEIAGFLADFEAIPLDALDTGPCL